MTDDLLTKADLDRTLAAFERRLLKRTLALGGLFAIVTIATAAILTRH